MEKSYECENTQWRKVQQGREDKHFQPKQAGINISINVKSGEKSDVKMQSGEKSSKVMESPVCGRQERIRGKVRFYAPVPFQINQIFLKINRIKTRHK